MKLPKSKIFSPRVLTFAGVMVVFAAIEWTLRREYLFPTHAIERRHVIVPELILESKIFGEYDGSSAIPFNIGSTPVELASVRGVRFKTGTYGKYDLFAKVFLRTREGETLCASQKKVQIAENQWSVAPLRCDQAKQAVGESLMIDVDFPGQDRWAVYNSRDGAPAIQLWLDDLRGPQTFMDARNYGSLWSPLVLMTLRVTSRILIALGAAFLLFPRGLTRRRHVYSGLILWCGVFWGQLFETVTFHNPDETMHAIGAFRSVVETEKWPSLYTEMQSLGGAVQLEETYAKVDQPIVAGQVGAAWVSNDHYFVDPQTRSGIYNAMIRPLAKASLHLSSQFEAICKDPVSILRILLGALTTLIVIGSCLFHIRFARKQACWMLLMIALIPAVLTSLLTVWNYGLLTILGILFCVNLAPGGERLGREKSLILAAGLIPVLGELALSQLLWFFVGPCAVTAAFLYSKSDHLTTISKLKSFVRVVLTSLFVYGALFAGLGDGFIPERGTIVTVINTLSTFTGADVSIFLSRPIATLFGMHVLAWVLSFFLLIAVERIFDKIVSLVKQSRMKALKVASSVVLVALVAYVIKKCWSIHDPLFVASLGSSQVPATFLLHAKDVYRALMSQMFIREQDYFFIKTFFMAYGWFEVTGHWLVYFVFRHLMEIGFLGILFASITNVKAFVRLYVPLIASFALYFVGIWYGTWAGHFTIVGRFVFPAIGLLLVPMLLVTSPPNLDENASENKVSHCLVWIFMYLVVNSVYGAFYLLPRRFIVGLIG